jgi:hypothetical protein
MHAMQASRLRTCRHCVAREPDRRDLPGGDHAVLPLSQPSDDFVPRGGRKSSFAFHAPRLAGKFARVTLRL